MSEAVFPTPEITPLSAPYWEGLREGVLRFQRCADCSHAWLPARAECPRCLQPDPRWEDAGGGARMVSWVVYHIAFHPAFRDRLPYNVAIVELDEGPRLVSNIVALDSDGGPRIDRHLRVLFEDEEGVTIPRFRYA